MIRVKATFLGTVAIYVAALMLAPPAAARALLAPFPYLLAAAALTIGIPVLLAGLLGERRFDATANTVVRAALHALRWVSPTRGRQAIAWWNAWAAKQNTPATAGEQSPS